MDPERFATLTRAISIMLSRRTVAGALGLSAAGLTSQVEARKKRKKRKRRKHKKKCGKVGGKPIKGKCCKRSIRVDGRCQRCDVCASGCAFSSVQDAIEAASAGDTIAICPGTFIETIEIAKHLTLVGVGDGAGPGNTILDGAGAGRVVFIGEGSTVTLQKLRITGGNGDDGGGIRNVDTLALIGCTVSGNTATSDGGGIFNLGTMALINSTVSGNTATFSGGGIRNSIATMKLIDSSVTANAAGSDGGGISNDDGTVICSGDSTVSGNTAGNPPMPSDCIDAGGGTGCATCPD